MTKVCQTHNVEALLKEGTSQKTGKAYSFYACPEEKCRWHLLQRPNYRPTGRIALFS
jgi:hypothetical protein